MTSTLSPLETNLKINLNQVASTPPPLQTPVILWALYQGELVSSRWVTACSQLPAAHINQQPEVYPNAVWVDENVTYPMRMNDFWSPINPN